jgi:hypothetical protein
MATVVFEGMSPNVCDDGGFYVLLSLLCGRSVVTAHNKASGRRVTVFTHEFTVGFWHVSSAW